jgi:hypothetical protein
MKPGLIWLSSIRLLILAAEQYPAAGLRATSIR